MSSQATGTYLERILSNTQHELRERMSAQPHESLMELISEQPATTSLSTALTSSDDVSIIAEFKRASPSKGDIAGAADRDAVVSAYLQGGCAALSVLTDATYFKGSLADLRAASLLAQDSRPRRPVLRKDFVVSPYQLAEARAHGADAVLLIVAALSNSGLGELMDAARDLDLECLVEVHDVEELDRALAEGAAIVGINNRDLRTFDVDLRTTEQIAPLVPDGVVTVSESGVGSVRDIERLRLAGIDAVLVGESLMRSHDPEQAVRELLGR